MVKNTMQMALAGGTRRGWMGIHLQIQSYTGGYIYKSKPVIWQNHI